MDSGWIAALTSLDSPEVRAGREMLTDVCDRMNADPAYAGIGDPRDAIEAHWPIVDLLRFLEHISVLVIKGEIADGLILAVYAEIFVEIWEKARPLIVARRAVLGPFTGRAFEHLAMRSKRYIDSGAMQREYAALERDPADGGEPHGSSGGPGRKPG